MNPLPYLKLLFSEIKKLAHRITDSDVDTDSSSDVDTYSLPDVDTHSLSDLFRFAYIPVTNRPSDSTRNILGIYFVFSIFPSSEDDSKMSQQVWMCIIPESYLQNENPPRLTYNTLADLLLPVETPSHPRIALPEGIMEPNMVSEIFIGKFGVYNFSGHQTAFINHCNKDVISNKSFHHDSWKSTEQSNSNGLHDGYSENGVRQPTFHTRHTNNISYDHYVTYKRGFEPSLDDTDSMQARSNDRQNSMYQSSPELSKGSYGKTLYLDSMDGSYHGNHSRQSSGSVVKRSRSNQTQLRKQSTASQIPLQFLKTSGTKEISKVDQTQIEIAEEIKQMRVKDDKNSSDDRQLFKNVSRENASPWQDVSPGRSIPEKNHHRGADKESESTAKNVERYREVMENELRRVMTSIDEVDSVALDMFGPKRTPIFFALLYNMVFEFDSKADIPKFIPEMSDSAIKLQVLSFLEYVLSIMDIVKTLLLSSPDSTRLQQMPEHEFVSLLQTVIASTIKQTKTKRSRFTIVNQEIFRRALGHGDLKSKLHHCIYFPLDCRLFVLIPTVKGSYWYRQDIQRASSRPDR